MKTLLTIVLILMSTASDAYGSTARVKIEYSYAIDMYCAEKVEPETLTTAQVSLIKNIPVYRAELNSKIEWLQSQWDQQGTPLLNATVQLTGMPFPMADLQAAVFLCPRFPSMGTPLAFNIISYLDSSAKDIPGLGKPLPIFFFVSTAFHEVLHKYINDILQKKPSAILLKVKDTDLYEAHLHLFALQKAVFGSLNLTYLLPQTEKLEALHGPEYVRAWKAVHANTVFYNELLAELKRK